MNLWIIEYLFRILNLISFKLNANFRLIKEFYMNKFNDNFINKNSK